MASTNINRVVLTGNLTRDPELRSLPSGMSVCSLRIASNTRRKDNSTEIYTLSLHDALPISSMLNCDHLALVGSTLHCHGWL